MLELILAALTGGFMGYAIAHFQMWFQVRGLLKELTEASESETTVIRIPVLKYEQVENSILFYDADDRFVCQGADLAEAAAQAEARGISLAVFQWQDGRKWFINGKVLDSHEVVNT